MTAALLQLLVAAGLVLAAALVGRLALVRRQERDRQTYVLRFPRAVTADQVQAFLASFAGRAAGKDALVFEVVAEAGQLEHRLRVGLRSVEFVLAQLRTAIPGVRTTRIENDEQPVSVTWAWSLLLTRHRVPLNTDQPESRSAALLGSLGPLGTGERLVLQWIITPRRARVAKPLRPKGEQTGAWRTADLLSGRKRASEPERREQLAKFSGSLFAAALRIGVSTPEAGHRPKQLLARPYAVLRGLRVPGADLWPLPAPRSVVARRLGQARLPVLAWPLLLNGGELAGVLGWPLGAVSVPGLSLGSAVQLAPSPMLPWHGLTLGTASFPGHERPVAIGLSDATKHLHVIGPTGSGKSNLLQHIFASGLEAGYGGLLIDPKGDLVADVLDRLPVKREQDVIIIDPLDARPVGLNLLDCANPADRELVVDGIVTAFRNRFSHSWGPRLEDCLRICVQSLAEIPGSTLVHIERLLTDAGTRRKVLGYVRDDTARRYWQWYDALNPRLRSEVIAPVLNKVRGTILRPSVQRLVGVQSTFHFDDVLRERKILLVSVPHGLLGSDTAALAGSLVYQQMWAAIQRRARVAHAERTPFLLVLDEFQQFVAGDSSFGDSLALARGYGAAIVCAHQHLSQLPPELRDAVLANARTKVCFALGAKDAAVMARELAPHVTAEDLRALDAYEAIVSPHVGSVQLAPLNVNTPPPLTPTGRAEAIRAMSRDRWGQPLTTGTPPAKETVAEPVLDGEDDPGPVGRRRL